MDWSINEELRSHKTRVPGYSRASPATRSFVLQLEDLGECYKLNPTCVIHYLSGARLEYSTTILKFVR